MRVEVTGKRYDLVFTHLHVNRGECDPPTKANKQIRIRKNLPPFEKLEVIVHELLHAADWHKDEDWVELAALDIARVLWALGYRDD